MVEPLRTSLDLQDQERPRLPCNFAQTLKAKSYTMMLWGALDRSVL